MRVLTLAIPLIIQNAITSFVSFLDNIMVGQIGTEQMSGVAIVNQLMFVFNIWYLWWGIRCRHFWYTVFWKRRL